MVQGATWFKARMVQGAHGSRRDMEPYFESIPVDAACGY